MEDRVTDWYPMTIPPVRVGWYDVTVGWPGHQAVVKCYWDGNLMSVQTQRLPHGMQFHPQRWRGLAHG